MLNPLWVQLQYNTHSVITPSALVVRGSLTAVPNAVTRIEGVSYLIEYSAVGSLSAAPTRRQETVKQPPGVVETGLGVRARRYSAPQAESVSRAGNLSQVPAMGCPPDH